MRCSTRSTRGSRSAGTGCGRWQERGPGGVLGFTGLLPATFDAPFTPAVEVGWRFARAAWGHGFATEAASAALDHGFDVAGLDEIVAMAVPRNHRSLAVMERLGMRRDAGGDFDHPRIEPGHPLRRHVLYRIAAAEWRERRSGRRQSGISPSPVNSRGPPRG